MLKQIKENISEFKPAIYFLLRFCITYAVLSGAYTIWVKSYSPAPDPATVVTAKHVYGLSKLFIEDAKMYYPDGQATVRIDVGGTGIDVFEGCNGLAIMILFLSFIIGYIGKWSKMAWFIPLGLVVIHLANLGRLLFLIYIDLHFSEQVFHFTHKYLFTLIIYVAVFLLWYWWVTRLNPLKLKRKAAAEE